MQHVQDRQTETGIKDGYTQFWIEDLVARARTLQKEQPHRSTTDIQTELLAWVDQHQADISNAFLTLEGEYSACIQQRG
jgi:hypothetical protein